jgi:DNA mismatch repair protein MutS2
MQQKALKTLEFDKIREWVMKFASSSLGKEKIEKLLPSVQLAEVSEWQDETDEGSNVLRLRGNIPLGGIFNVRPHVKRAEIGGMLNAAELNQIASTLHASRVITKFIEDVVQSGVELPMLVQLTSEMSILTPLEHEIKQAIDESGEVLDSASDSLRNIRQQLRRTEGRVREKLESMIRSSAAQTRLSDAIITIRNDRYVIPVKQEYRGHYGGIVHDQSSSGQTLFIEPESVVQLNNQVREMKANEQEEIERILLELSGKVSGFGVEIRLIVDTLGTIDFIFSKAKFGQAIKGTRPIMNEKGFIRLHKARHPFIKIEEAVANDIQLGIDFTSIVITGPNTGGKTVTLKTVGLCTLMAQAGLPIPALDGSEMAVFEQVFADIGDEQSIEQSLSTFSSHMVNIVDILKQVTENSLVLFDELGAGTDPQEGAALAISILDEVHLSGARVIATTHYPELKAYGYNRKEVVNASVEFNVETLSPTYKLLIGVPGRSNAFEISKRLGLSESTIQNARAHIGTDSHKVETMIASLEDSRRAQQKEEKEANDFLRQSETIFQDMQKQMQEFYEKKDRLYEKAQEKADKVLDTAKAESEEIIRELRRMRIEKKTDVKEHELIDAKDRLNKVTPTLVKGVKGAKKTPEKKKERTLMPGDEVNVLTFNQKGYLIEKVSDNEWQVQMGIMKMKVSESSLERIKGQKQVETKPIVTVKGNDHHVSLELDLRGERFESALQRVEKYIDDALLAGYPRVSIIHGKGTGALRQGVQEYLKNHRSVKRSGFGEASEGGSGVTIVEFK